MYLKTRIFPTSGYARVLLFMFIRGELGGTHTGCLFQFTYFVFVSVCYMCPVVTCWEKADLLALVWGVQLWVCHFPIGILGQVWYLIVSIPDLCTLTYFKSLLRKGLFPAQNVWTFKWWNHFKDALMKKLSYIFCLKSSKTIRSQLWYHMLHLFIPEISTNFSQILFASRICRKVLLAWERKF